MMIEALSIFPLIYKLRPSAEARGWEHIVKIGRTHLMDAVPITLGRVLQQVEPGAESD